MQQATKCTFPLKHFFTSMHLPWSISYLDFWLHPTWILAVIISWPNCPVFLLYKPLATWKSVLLTYSTCHVSLLQCSRLAPRQSFLTVVLPLLSSGLLILLTPWTVTTPAYLPGKRHSKCSPASMPLPILSFWLNHDSSFLRNKAATFFLFSMKPFFFFFYISLDWDITTYGKMHWYEECSSMSFDNCIYHNPYIEYHHHPGTHHIPPSLTTPSLHQRQPLIWFLSTD